MFLTDVRDPDRMMDGSYGDGMMDGSWGFWMMALLGVLLVVIIGVTAVLALRAAGGQSSATAHGVATPPSSPREVLDQRLARGEISQTEYGSTRALFDS